MLLIVHGGAGTRKPSKISLKKLSQSLSSGFRILTEGGSALHAVLLSIRILEDSGLFNAGLGGNVQSDGVRRLDASLMHGKDLKAGSVVGLEGIRNPIEAARYIMETPHVMMTNTGGKKIAERHNLAPLPAPDKTELLNLSKKMEKDEIFSGLYNRYFSTVGAVALDREGNVASGASTGGIRLMLPGRVGDTPVIGAGIYADNSLGAVACTGTGEYIIRLSLAKEIVMHLDDMTPRTSVRCALKRLLRLGGEAGVIALNPAGKTAVMHTTPYMASGYANRKGIVVREGFRALTPHSP